MTTTQTEIILAPRNGLRFDESPDLISSLELSDGQNFFYEDGLLKKRYGYEQMGDNLPLSGAIMGIDQFYKFSGSNYLIALTTLDAYQWNTSTDEWDYLTEHTSIDDCETNWTAKANVATALDGTNIKEGTYSVKITPAADFTTGILAYHDSAIGDISDYNYVRFWIKSSIALTAGQLQFLIDDTAACASPLRTLDLPALVANTWTEALLDMRVAGSTSDLTSIASIGLQAAEDFGACNIYIDDVRVFKCFTGTTSDFFSYDYIRKNTETDLWWVCSNGVDNIKKYDGTTFQDLGGSPPLAKYVIQFKTYLHALRTKESGSSYYQRDRWPDTADPENWTTGNANYKDLTGSDFISGAALFDDDHLIVFKERSILIVYPTGDSEIFEYDGTVKGRGCSAGRTVSVIGKDIAYLGWDDVYLFNGISSDSISKSIRKELFARMIPSEMTNCFGLLIEEQKEYWLCTTPLVWSYNYDIGRWFKHSLYNTMTAFGYYYLESAVKIGDLTDLIRNLNWRIGDRTILSEAPVTLLGDEDGYIYKYSALKNSDDGNAIDAYFDTKDFVFTKWQARQRIIRLDTYYTGPSLQIYYSTDKGVTWTLLTTLDDSTTLETPQVTRFRINCRRIRFRFRNAVANEHVEVEKAIIYWQESGTRIVA
jgi:hypothetical protein